MFFLYVIIFFLFFLLPLVFLLLMPGKKSLFILSVLLLYHFLRSDLALEENGLGYFGRFDLYAHYTFIVAVVFGTTVRSFLLLRKRRKMVEPPPFWSWKENLLIFAFVGVLVFSQLYWSSGVCLSEMKALTKDEIVGRYFTKSDWGDISEEELKEKKASRAKRLEGFYRVSDYERPLLGSKRLFIERYRESESDVVLVRSYLNQCGERIYDLPRRFWLKKEHGKEIKDQYTLIIPEQ